MPDRIPWGELQALFFDAGNTLVAMDFELIVDVLSALGHACSPGALARAEAAARPAISAKVGGGVSTEGFDLRAFYFDRILAGALEVEERERARLLEAVVAWLREPGISGRLWSAVLPGVAESLAALREAGLSLLVVSNSDGSIEAGLRDVGLRGYFDAVLDSSVVGFEKPDPRIFQRALELAGSDPLRTAHVGDLYSADVAGARAAGLHGVLLDPHGDWGEVDCATVPDLPDLTRRVLEFR